MRRFALPIICTALLAGATPALAETACVAGNNVVDHGQVTEGTIVARGNGINCPSGTRTVTLETKAVGKASKNKNRQKTNPSPSGNSNIIIGDHNVIGDTYIFEQDGRK